MAHAVLAGPLGLESRQTLPDEGTSTLSPSPRPGPVGLDTPSGENWTLDATGVPQQARPFAPSKPAVPAVTPEGESRPLTSGEIEMARQIFKDSIDYAQVRVHREEYLPFGLQNDDTAMTPNGEMYFNPKRFKEDFSKEANWLKHWYVHEMVHVWQHQLGYWVRLRGAIRIGVGYDYKLEAGKKLGDYNMESQGDLLSDYYSLKFLNDPDSMIQKQFAGQLPLFEEVLDVFLKNPADKANLP